MHRRRWLFRAEYSAHGAHNICYSSGWLVFKIRFGSQAARRLPLRNPRFSAGKGC